MKELSFHAELYDAQALAETARVYAKVADCAVETGAERHQVRITSKGRIDEARIAAEFGNYALGATVMGRRVGKDS